MKKNNILENDFKEVTLQEQRLKLIQKQRKSKNLTMEDVEKDIIPVFSNKKKSFLTLIIFFHGFIKEKNINYYYQNLEKTIYLQKN